MEMLITMAKIRKTKTRRPHRGGRTRKVIVKASSSSKKK